LQLPAELADGAENLFVDIEPGKTLLIGLLTEGEFVARYADASRHGCNAIHGRCSLGPGVGEAKVRLAGPWPKSFFGSLMV
jgi:hypothetical protein